MAVECCLTLTVHIVWLMQNDGFGGGSVVTENLGYNTCRESSDHAVFNSWDRQPFLTDVGQKAPEPDLNPAYNTIARNFFIGERAPPIKLSAAAWDAPQ